jgi:hypothetical protein
VKRTVYKVEGVLDYQPDELPEGLSVTEIEVDDPKSVLVRAGGGQEIRVFENDYGQGPVVVFQFVGRIGDYLSLDSAREVRDCLNAILGEGKPTRRVFAEERELDGSWRWWETAPDRWTYETSWAEALQGVESDDPLLVNVDWDKVILDAGSTLVDVTSEHPEVNR